MSRYRRENFEILRTIVQSISIFVVDNFLASQLATKKFFHYVSVFINSLAIDTYNAITLIWFNVASSGRCVTLDIWASIPIPSSIMLGTPTTPVDFIFASIYCTSHPKNIAMTEVNVNAMWRLRCL